MKELVIFVVKAWNSFIADGCFYRAASLAYTSLLALVPLVGVGMYLLSFFPSIKFLGQRIQEFVFSNLVVSSSEVVGRYVAMFSNQVTHMSLISIAALVIVIILLMFSVEDALNKIWKLPERPGRFAILRALGRHWLTLIFITALLGSSVMLSSYLTTLSFVHQAATVINFRNTVIFMLPKLLLFLAFMVLYKFIPATSVRYLHATIGSLVCILLFEISKQLFQLYIYFFPTYRILYGAFAAIPLFLIWIYVVWLIVLLAAEITWLLGQDSRKMRSRL